MRWGGKAEEGGGEEEGERKEGREEERRWGEEGWFVGLSVNTFQPGVLSQLHIYQVHVNWSSSSFTYLLYLDVFLFLFLFCSLLLIDERPVTKESSFLHNKLPFIQVIYICLCKTLLLVLVFLIDSIVFNAINAVNDALCFPTFPWYNGECKFVLSLKLLPSQFL